MPTPVFRSICALRNAATFLDFPPPAQTVDFLRYNLIYGFNGSGKTTLSRLIEALRIDGFRENLPDGCECTFELADGSKVSLLQDPSQTAVGSKIAVFNEDFVERSLTWKSGEAEPIIYIGEEQGELADEIEKAEASLTALQDAETLASGAWSSANRELGTLKTDVARLIANELGIVRGYDARQLKSDFDQRTYKIDERLSDEKLAELKELINRKDVGEPIAIAAMPNELDDLERKVTSCLSMTVERLTVEALERRPDALPWVREGIQLHVAELDCLFCDQPLPTLRLEQLQLALGEGFNQLSQEISDCDTRVANAIASLRTYREGLPSSFAGALPGFRTELGTETKSARELATSVERLLARWRRQLSEKSANANTGVVLARKTDDPNSTKILELNHRIADVEARHNAEIEKFSEVKDRAKSSLKCHHLAGDQSRYLETIQNEAQLRSEYDEAKAAREAGAKAVELLKARLKEHAPAADVLNRLLKSYLGHDGIRLTVVEDGYQICRGNKVATKPLSEGEKTAVAFCYFLANLECEGKKIKDLIVIVDDPISSLDTRAMTYVFALIKSKLANAAQLFILTHNLDFLRENKKWLNNKYRPREGTEKTAEFLFVEGFNDSEGKRRARIVGLPSLISEYDSEYHYLYSLIEGLVQAPEEFIRFQYLMPNAMRKVLEIFLAFKIPGSSGFSDKINQIIARYPALDEGKIRALEQLSHLESHSENIGDVTTFSGFTLEQVTDAAKTLLDMIKVVDDSHGKDMDGLCRKARVR